LSTRHCVTVSAVLFAMDAIDLTEEDQPADGADVKALEVELLSVEAELQEVTWHTEALSCYVLQAGCPNIWCCCHL
jgi:hypothetical protein